MNARWILVLGAALAVPLIGLILVTLLLGLFASSQAIQASACAQVTPGLTQTGPVRLPVVGGFQVTSEFGMRSNPGDVHHGQYRLHAGLDFAETPTPGPVVAAMAGQVTGAAMTGDAGNMVTIDVGDNTVIKYLHFAEMTVHPGQRVAAGQQVGIEGSTGNSSGPHVHFQVEVAGTPVNPRSWLTQHGVTVPAPRGTGTAPAATSAPAAGSSAPAAGSASPATPVSRTTDSGQTKPLAQTWPSTIAGYSGDQLTIAGQIIVAGQNRHLDAHTITLAVMTGMGESTLTNVAHGDAARNDTIGVFQEGPERGPYAQRMDPTGAANIFYTYLTRVPGYQSLQPTIAAHKAQANADPNYYAKFWDPAVKVVSAMTADPDLATHLQAATPISGCTGAPGAAAASAQAAAQSKPSTSATPGPAVAAAARRFVGTPYSWGAGTPTGPSIGINASPALNGSTTLGFDGSGLVQYAVHAGTGLTLPHDITAQGNTTQGTPIPEGNEQPGDVITLTSGAATYTGIYVGNGQIVTALQPGTTVQAITVRGVARWEHLTWTIRRYH